MASGCSEDTIRKAVDSLKELCKTHSGSSLNGELRRMISELKSSLLRHSSSARTFNVSGGTNILVKLLSQCACAGQDAVLLLGVLGNVCALDKGSRDTVQPEHAMIVRAMSDTKQSDVLNTGARLLANLALDTDNIPSLLNDGVVPLLIKSLALASGSCKRSILRTIRLLSTSAECRNQLDNVDGVQAVAECLQSCDRHVITASMQTLQAITVDSDLVAPLHENRTLQVVIRQCHSSEATCREHALKLLIKVVKCSEGRAALSSAGGVETLVGLLESYSEQQGLLREVVTALCLCCRDVTSRQRLRDCGGLRSLIILLKDQQQSCLHRSIVSALVCYYFDETTLKSMTKSLGLLPALVESLVSSSPQYQTEDSTCSSQRDVSPLEIDFEPSPPENPILLPCTELSNEPLITEPQIPQITSDDLSLFTPPPNKRPTLELDFESSTYVPPNFLDSILSSPSPYTVEERRPIRALPDSLHYQVVLLLSRVSHLRDCHAELSQPDTLSRIIQYFVSTDPPNLHVFKMLTRVFANPHCFQNTLRTLAPSKLLHSSQSNEALSTCCGELLQRLGKVAESPFGQGALAHLLLRGDKKEREASALAAAILCRSVRVCKKLMLSYGGFQEICELAGPESELQSLALDSLLELVARIPHLQHTPLPPTPPPSHSHCRHMDSDHLPFDLTLVISDCEVTASVQVHREVLAQASDMFRVMLEGPYSEARSNKVTLRDTPPLAFVGVVHHLYGCSWQCPKALLHPTINDKSQPCSNESLITSIAGDSSEAAHCLRVLSCAGKYLLSELSTLCQHAAVQYVLPSNVVEMFYFARLHECYCLSESCIRLVMTMGESRSEVFSNMISSYVGDEVLSMLKMFLSIA